MNGMARSAYGPRRIAGLTIIEVLVAMTLLAIVASALVGTFAFMSTTNRDASLDVDYSRLVRSVGDGIADDWAVPSEWNAATVGGYELPQYVTNETDQRCVGSWAEGDVPVVRVITITCQAAGGLEAQAYQFELGSPNE